MYTYADFLESTFNGNILKVEYHTTLLTNRHVFSLNNQSNNDANSFFVVSDSQNIFEITTAIIR